jgi:hypothetical protein
VSIDLAVQLDIYGIQLKQDSDGGWFVLNDRQYMTIDEIINGNISSASHD